MLIEHIANVLTSGLLAAAEALVANVIAWLGPVFRSLVVIYLAVWGYMLWAGASEEPLRDSIFKFIRVSAIATFAVGMGFYVTHVIELAWEGPREIVSAITGGMANDPIDILGNVWDQMRVKAHEALNMGGFFDWGGKLAGLMIAGVILAATYAFCVPVLILILAGKLMTAILLVVGPFCIAAALFKRGVQITQQWVGQLLNYFMLYVLAMVLMSLAAEIFVNLITDGIESRSPDLGTATEVLLIALMMMYATTWVPGMAGALAGSMSAPVEGMIGKMTSPAKRFVGGQAQNAFRKSAEQRGKAGFARQYLAGQWQNSTTRNAGRAMYQKMGGNSMRRR